PGRRSVAARLRPSAVAGHGPGTTPRPLPDQLGDLPLERSDHHRTPADPQFARFHWLVRAQDLRQGDDHDARHACEPRLRRPGPGMTRAAARGRFRQRLLVLFLLAMLIPYARQVASSPTLGQDFRAFFAAATVVAHQGEPYNWPALGAAEYRLYDASGGIKPGDPTYYEFLAYPEGPWLAFALVPLTSLPWPVAYALFAVLLGLILLAAAFGTFTLLGWPRRRAALAAGCTLLSAIGFINLFMGQVSVIVFGAFVAAWLLASRGRPWLAGAVLALVWMKPNIGLRLPLVLALLEPAVSRRMIGGFIAASAAIFGVAFTVLGTGFFDWPLQVPRM